MSAGSPATAAAQPSATPQSHFPKQAIVVIHGIGEQRPMDTITDFVRAVWETDPDVCRNDKPLPAETWSKPDVRTGSLELRRITTRESTPTPAFPRGVRSDFYELYWADLSAGSTWDEVRSWVATLLCRNPFTSVPRDVMLAWIALWVLCLVILALLIASVLPRDATIFHTPFRDFWPFSFLLRWQTWELAAVAAVLAWLAHSVAVPYAGRVVRYTRATPDNIAARKDIRERGLALLDELHKKDYQRIIVVGHSLGSILAYDLVSYFWARRDASRTLVEGTAEFEALRRLEQSLIAFEKKPSDEAVAAFRQAQQNLSRLLRQRPSPQGEEPDGRWLITDLVTLGSPLAHADFLLGKSAKDMDERILRREFPTCPPVREVLDDWSLGEARKTDLPLDEAEPKLLCFPLRKDREWQLHHAAPFAAVSWTNIHDPARLVFAGDIISGPLAFRFGKAVRDVDLRALRGQSIGFSHTNYWRLSRAGSAGADVRALREALDLSGLRLPVA